MRNVGAFSAGHRSRGVLVALAATALVVANTANTASAATVPLATAANYAVLGGQTVTNTGPSTLNGSLGVAPGSAISGFPPGQVIAPGTTDNANAAAAAAQADLIIAYDNAAGRPVSVTLAGVPSAPAELGGLTLVGGVYSGASKAPLGLTGSLTLDGQGDPNSVFVFQTATTLTTASASQVNLINGAQECNVFWQIGSSAALGSNSVFAGNILALTTITLGAGVTVHGRALARNGEVTLISDTFTRPTCALSAPVETTAAPVATSEAVTTTAPGAVTTTGSTTPGGGTTSVPTRIPETGSPTKTTFVLATVLITLGVAATVLARRRMNPTE